jgi:hypothetical protein
MNSLLKAWTFVSVLVGTLVILLWILGTIGVGDFVICFGPKGHCAGIVR